MYFCNNFWFRKGTRTTVILRASVSLVKTRRMNYVTLKSHSPKVKVMTWSEKVMLHISRSVSSAWTRIWYFHRSSLFIESYCWKTACDFMTWNDLGDMRRGIATGRNIPTQRVKSTTCNPTFESASNGFSPKETPFIVLPLTYHM